MPDTHKANSSLNQSMSSGAETEKTKRQKIARTKCFFDMEFNKHPVGRIIFELHNEQCPRTCENFRSLCTGERGLGITTNRRLYYKGSPIHRVVKNFIIQGGDFTDGDGTGGESIYGGCFADENLEGKHEKAFLLSMANRGKDTNGSQFFITTAPAPHLDGKHVVFGHVIKGQEILKLIENMPTNEQDRPLTNVEISHCGELILRIKKKKKSKNSSSSSSSTSSSPSDSDESEGKKKEKKKKADRENDIESQILEVKADAAKVEESEFCSVRPEEVPPVPENKFLKRRTDGPASVQPERKRSRSRDLYRDAAGRKVKGRGVLRYTGRSRSRSRTPPLWRRVTNERKHLPESRDRQKNVKNYENFVKERRPRRLSPARRHRSKSRDHSRKSRSFSPKMDKSRERSRDKKRSKSHEKVREKSGKNDENVIVEKEKSVEKLSKSKDNVKEKNDRERSRPRSSSRDRYSRRFRRKKSHSRRSASSGSRSSPSHSRHKLNRHRRSKSKD